MSTVLPLHRTVAIATARYILDHNDLHSQECRTQAQMIVRQLKSDFYTAVSDDVLEQFLTSFPKELSGELLSALVPPHLKSLPLKDCQKFIDEQHAGKYQDLSAVLNRCCRLQSLSLENCNLHSSLDLCSTITQNASGLSSLCLERCNRVTDEMVQTFIVALPTLKHLNLCMLRQITDKVFALHLKPDETFGHLSEVGHLLEVGQRDVLDIATANSRDACPRPGSNISSVELGGCRHLSSTCIRHLTELCGPGLKSLNVANTGMDCTILWYLSGYSLSTIGELALLANKNLKGQDTSQGVQLAELLKDLQNLKQQFEEKVELVEKNTGEIKDVSREGGNRRLNHDKTSYDQPGTEMASNQWEDEIVLSSGHVKECPYEVLEEKTVSEQTLNVGIESDYLSLVTEQTTMTERKCLVAGANNSSACDDGMNEYYSHNTQIHPDLNDQPNVGLSSCFIKEKDYADRHIQNESGASGILSDNYFKVDNHSKDTLFKEDIFGDSSHQTNVSSLGSAIKLENTSFDKCATDNDMIKTVGSFIDEKPVLAIPNVSNNIASIDNQRSNSAITESAVKLSIVPETESVASVPVSATSAEVISMQQSRCSTAVEVRDNADTESCLQRLYNPMIMSLDISNIQFDEILAMTCLQEFFQANKELKSLTISWSQLQDSLLEIIANASSKLQYLALYDCESITSPGLAHLLARCPKLKQLDLQGASFVCDLGLMPIFLEGEESEITSLQLSETNVTNTTLSHIAKNLGSKLTSLELSWCEEITGVGISMVASKCSSLKKFHARQGKLSGDSLIALSQNCTGLTCLNLSSVECLTDDVILEMTHHLHQIKELDISWNLALTDTSISAVMRNCPLMTELNAAGLKRITEKPLLPIVSDFNRWRRCVALIHLKMRERVLLQRIGEPQLSSDEEYEDLYVPVRSTSYIPNLNYIDLQYCDRPKDNVLAEIVAICRGTLTIQDYYGQEIIPKLLHGLTE